MRDELERLLRMEEEEPEQVAEMLNFRTAAYSVQREGAPVSAEIPEEQAVLLSGEERETSGFLRSETEGAEGETYRRENARSLYRMLSQTRRMARTAARPGEKVRTPMVRQETAEAGHGQDARWLDRIFQRDARRYDGGFTWQ